MIYLLLFCLNNTTPEACVAAVRRDSDGRVLLVAATQVKSIDSELADVEAMLSGLKLVVARVGERCIIVSDDMNQVKYVTNQASIPPWCIAHIIHECRNFVQCESELGIWSMISNAAAHKIGRRYLNLNLYDNWLFETLPSHLLDELYISARNQCYI